MSRHTGWIPEPPVLPRGWLWHQGWWRKGEWVIQVKITAQAQSMFSQADLQISDVVQYVTHVEQTQHLAKSNLGIEVLFDYSDLSRSSPLESIDVELNPFDAASLERAIRSGCLRSLKYLRIHSDTGYQLRLLAKAMASHGLPSLETLILNRVDMDRYGFEAYGVALASQMLPKLSCFHLSWRALVRNEVVNSIVLAIRSSNHINWAIGITHHGVTVLSNVASLFSYLRSLVLSSENLQNLTFLDVAGIGTGDEAVKPLGVAIRSGVLRNLAELRLNKIGLTDEGLIALVDSIQEGVGRLLPNLISLDIGLNSFTEVGLLSLSNALSSGNLPKLSCLDISGNNIGDEAVNCLGIAIWSGELTNLAELRLNKIGLTVEGFVTLMGVFQKGVASLLKNPETWGQLFHP